MLPGVRFRNVEVEVKAMGEGSDHDSWQWKQVLDILTHSWDNFFLYWFPWNLYTLPPPPGNQSKKDCNLPNTVLLLLLIIESLSHYQEEPKLIEAEHAVEAGFCPASSDSTGHLGTHQEASPSQWRSACKDWWSEIVCTCRGWSQQPGRHRRRSKWLRSGLQNNQRGEWSVLANRPRLLTQTREPEPT